MTMSRKYYREAAENLNRQLRNSTPVTIDAKAQTIRETADDLAGMFARDNSAFSRSQFMDAVYNK
jgi:hypothetical protein